MYPIVITLKDEKNTDSRTIAYELFVKETLVVIQQQLNEKEWATVNHMAVPIVCLATYNFSDLKKPYLKDHNTRWIL